MSKRINYTCLLDKKHTIAKLSFFTELAEIAYDKHDVDKGRYARDHARSLQRYLNLGFPNIKFIINDKTDTQVYVIHNDISIIVCFRGTENDTDWAKNFQFGKTKPEDSQMTQSKCGEVHQGFYGNMSSVYDELASYITSIPIYRAKDLYVCGHSLGAALTTLFFRFFDSRVPFTGGYAIASPKSGNKKFMKSFDKMSQGRFIRVTNNADVVCKVPLYSMGYYHVDKEVYITARRSIKRKSSMFFRGFDQTWGSLKGIFKKNKGITDDHHPVYYMAAFCKALKIENPLKIWPEYR